MQNNIYKKHNSPELTLFFSGKQNLYQTPKIGALVNILKPTLVIGF